MGDANLPAVTYDSASGVVEMHGTPPSNRFLVGKDIMPTSKTQRTWGFWAYIGNWSVVVDAAPFAVGGAAIALGAPILTAILISLVSIVFLYFLIAIQSHAASRYGVAEPQLERVRFGIYGAYIASLTRGIIALGWFGIQTYVFTEVADAFYFMAIGKTSELTKVASLGPLAMFHTDPVLFIGTFIGVYFFEMLLMYLAKVEKSQQVVKWVLMANIPLAFIAFGAPWFVEMGMAGWNWSSILSVTSPHITTAGYIAIFVLMNAVLADVITISMSMPDLTRFARTQKIQYLSQLAVIPMYFIVTTWGILAAAASFRIYGFVIYDPVLMMTISSSSIITKVFILLLMAYGTYAVNVQANLLPPSYDFSNILPGKLSFWRGAVIAIIISLLIQGWALYYNAVSFLEGWLGLYGTFLGPIVGIIFLDYLIIRRFRFDVRQLYYSKGQFRYLGGFNPAAVISLAVAVAVLFAPIPGHAIMSDLSTFFGFGIAGVLYLLLMKFWVIPKYQPFLKGGLIHGYSTDELDALFGGRTVHGGSENN
ncbi:MAG: cytosine permease [Candidatus Bathyarchaeia archaeon]